MDQHLSTVAVFKALDIGLEELPDWNCCGATPGHTIGGDLSLELSGRNLDIASKMNRPVLVPCASCYHNLRKAALHRRETAAAPVEVVSIASFLASPAVLNRLKTKLKISLSGLRIAPYYGCLLTRPQCVSGASDVENPTQIDEVASACGAQVVSWPYKTDCCGGPHTLAHPELVAEMSTPLLDMAQRWGADVIVTACPMCHTSLDSTLWNRRRSISNSHIIPVLYLSELTALAMALRNSERFLKKHLVNPMPLLREKGALR